MAVVKLELDRERALRELVRIANYLKRSPADVKAALNELTEKDGLEQLLKNAPLVGAPPAEPPKEEEPAPPAESGVPAGFKYLYEDAFPTVSGSPSPFVTGSDNQAGAIKGVGNTAVINLSGERAEFSMYKQPRNSGASWAPGDEIYFTAGLKIGAGRFTYGGPGHHCTISQFFKGIGSSGGGSPTQSLELADYGQGRGLYIADGSAHRKLASISEGVRHVLAWRCKGSTSANGSFEVWLDGTRVESQTGKVTQQGTTSVSKFGLYGGAGELTWDNAKLYVRA